MIPEHEILIARIRTAAMLLELGDIDDCLTGKPTHWLEACYRLLADGILTFKEGKPICRTDVCMVGPVLRLLDDAIIVWGPPYAGLTST